MSRQVSPSTDRVYGLQRVTRIWGVSRATVYRHRHQPEAIERRRPGPLGAMADEELVRAIRQLLQDSPFHGEGYRKLWARLRFAGIRTSRRRVLRLMREHGLLAHQRAGRPRGSRAHDGTITTERVDLMWGTDLTSVMTGEGQAAVFIAVDHCSAECVGIHASRSADRFEALEPVRQGVRERFGAFAKDVAAGLALRHDHGSQYVSHHFQAEIRFLGIESSPAFVREPEGNGCAERFIRVLKENLLWVRRFDTIEELRLALHRVQADLQPDLDHRAARLPDTRPGPSRSARPDAHGRVSADRCLKTVDRYSSVRSRCQRALADEKRGLLLFLRADGSLMVDGAGCRSRCVRLTSRRAASTIPHTGLESIRECGDRSQYRREYGRVGTRRCQPACAARDR